MLNSAVLSTALGLIALFAVTSVLCSGVTEALSNFSQMRAKYLLTGLRAMLDQAEVRSGADKAAKKALNDEVQAPATTQYAAAAIKNRIRDGQSQLPGSHPFTLALFDSQFVKSLQTRRVGVLRNGRLRNPQYLSHTTFVRALIDLLLPDLADPAAASTQPGGAPAVPSVLDQVRGGVSSLPEGLALRAQLLALIARSQGELAAFETSLESWYDDQMAVIAGWYKRWSRVVLGVVGVVIAVLLNIDTLQVAHSLYVDTPTQQAVVSTAASGTLCQNGKTPDERASCARDELANLHIAGLPLGYAKGCDPGHGTWKRCWSWSSTAQLRWWNFEEKVLGWLLTGFGVSFGAPFWFDALSRLGSLRNTGPKPASS
jgi:hypothetical protein